MLGNYFKVAFRNIWKNKFYNFISIAGLAIGLAAGMLILLWCQNQKNYNQNNQHAEVVYRVIPNFLANGNKSYFPTVPSAVAYVSLQIPTVEKRGRMLRNFIEPTVRYENKNFNEKNSAFIDPALFEILDIPFTEGDRKNPFRDNRSIVLTEAFAIKYFGKEDPMGKVLKLNIMDNYTVTGIVRLPRNSDLKYDFFVPMNIINEFYGNPKDPRQGLDGDWRNYDYEMFVQLQPSANPKDVAAQLTALQKANNSDDLTKTLDYSLQPLANMHLYNPDGSEGLITMVRIFMSVAFAILLIASINYVNLTTAKAAQRAREIGVRKVIGAGKTQLFMQFICESFIVFMSAFILALITIKLVFPLYMKLAGTDITFNLLEPTVLKVIGWTALITLAVAGIYPAVLLASFKPLLAIKGKFSIGRGNHLLRKLLVVCQFSFSIILIICTIIIGGQLRYIQSRNLGLDKENVFRFDMRNIYGHYDAVKNELLKDPSIKSCTASGQDVLQVGANTTENDWDGKEPGKNLLISSLPVERDFFSTMHVKLLAGHGFSGTPADSAYYILNETAIREMGLKDPVGKRFTFHLAKGTIAGVVQDFHFKNMHQKIEPLLMLWKPEWIRSMYIRTTGAHIHDALAATERIWAKYNPDYPFEYAFLDDTFNKMYASDRQIGLLFKVFAFIAIFISCLGLFGLVTYTAQLKTREIGIRKVLGATVSSVTALLAKDFIRLIIVAILIASPFGWYFMNRWLQDFAYRIPINWWVFPASAALVLLIALLTISLQAVKAALANPVKSLRTE